MKASHIAPVRRAAVQRFGDAAAGVALLAGVYVLIVRRWHQRWGATTAEVAAPMAGDEIILTPNWSVTRAVSIEAPPTAVWPWLAQMGYRRGGLYTYDSLDRLFGVLDRPSANSVLPEFQHLSVGDVIPIANDPGWPVAAVEWERLLVLDIKRPRLHITWSVLLTPTPEALFLKAALAATSELLEVTTEARSRSRKPSSRVKSRITSARRQRGAGALVYCPARTVRNR